MKIEPLGDQVLVKMDKPEKAAEGVDCRMPVACHPQRGTVQAVGPGEEKPMTVKKGDRVLLKSYCGERVEIKGREHRMIKACDIMACLEDEEDDDK
jgi:chaperonin GroES